MAIDLEREAHLRDVFAKRWGPYFTYEEFKCKSGLVLTPIDHPEFTGFMDILVEVRMEANFPFPINSGYRSPPYNAQLSSTGEDGPHVWGAADIKCAFERQYTLCEIAFRRGLGVGIRAHGPVAGRFNHLDNLGKRIWTYNA